MIFSRFCFLAILLMSAPSWADAPADPEVQPPLTEVERGNLLDHAQDLRTEGASLTQQAREIDLDAMKKELAAKEAQLKSVAHLLSTEALETRNEEVDQLRMAV